MKERGNALLRWVDRYFGIPLVFLFGCFKRRKPLPDLKTIHSIAILQTAGIGDTVLLIPVLQDLRAHFPEAKLLLFTGKSNYEMARLIPGINVIALPVTRPFSALRIIRRHAFDLWVDTGQWARLNAVFSFFSRSRFKIGFKTAFQYRHSVYDHAVLHRSDVHECDNFKSLLFVLGIFSSSLPKLALPLVVSQPKLIVLHLHAGGSRHYLKEWPVENWVQLIDILTAQGFEVALTGSARDASSLFSVKAACKEKERIQIPAGLYNFSETAKLLKEAGAVISIDTGIMHVAAALGCPLVALHGPTSPARWGAIGPNVEVVAPLKVYRTCIHLGFESTCRENRCMQMIQVPQVLRALDKLLKGSPCAP